MIYYLLGGIVALFVSVWILFGPILACGLAIDCKWQRNPFLNALAIVIGGPVAWWFFIMAEPRWSQ